jgi:hypothetical protein
MRSARCRCLHDEVRCRLHDGSPPPPPGK